MRLQLPFWGKLVRSSTMISGKEYTRRISKPLARQKVTAVYHMSLKRFYNEIGLFLYHAMTIVRGNDSSGSDPGKKSYD